jgi:SAM-dependent methyltransferase
VRLLDLGAGPATFTRRAAARFAELTVIPVEPSREFARPGIVRAAGEALPLADRSIDVAICLSSIRHVRDRAATLRELRRVVRGVLVIVELDPAADRGRIAAHADRLGGPALRWLFGPLVVRTAPPAATIATLARGAGFAVRALRADSIQPVYIMELA